MRNLKRVLSLALALVMVLGMMVINTSAATYTDADEITYEEAIAVMTGIGVFEGNPDGSLKPTEILTRQEAATIITRIMLGKKVASGLAPTEQIFDDVATTKWSAAAIEYCYNIDMIDGLGDGTFDPDGELTGIAFAKMLLCAMGYDADAEGYTGSDWKKNIKEDAYDAGLYISGVSIADALTREAAAQMILQAMDADMVAYGTAFDKSTMANTVIGPFAVENDVVVASKTYNGDVDGYTQFAENYFPNLKLVKGGHDEWGRPIDHEWYYNPSVVPLYTVMVDPDLVYTTEVSECDVAKALKLKKATTAVVAETLNGDAANFTDGGIETAYSALKKIGAQGRLTEVYNLKNGIEIVYVDEFLAKVTDVTDVKYDKNGHITSSAKLALTVYASHYGFDVVLTDTTNWEYSVGDMLLVNYDDESWTTWAATPDEDGYVEIIGYAESMVGAQTSFTTKASHIVAGTEYPDAVQFNHDDSEKTSIVDYTWYFDSYDNLIGAFTINTKYSYGTISSIYWQDSFGGELGYALATITYMDGTQETAKIYSITGMVPADLDNDGTIEEDEWAMTTRTLYGVEGQSAVYNLGAVSSTKQYNDTWYVGTTEMNKGGDYTNVALYKIASTARGLMLTETNSTWAGIETGVPAMVGEADLHSGNATQYLVWNTNIGEYETYTGIKNVPSYEEGVVHYVDTTKPYADGVVEYVFITADASAALGTATFYWNTSLTVETVLNPYTGGDYYYIVSGGYVNGVKDDIVIPAARATVLADLTARSASGVLFVLNNSNGLTYNAAPVKGGTPVYVPSIQSYVAYEGILDGAVLAQDVLVINGNSYDVENVAEISSLYDLDETHEYFADNAYIYVVYTKNPAKVVEKVASLIYITTTPGTDAETVAPLYDVAKALYEAAAAKVTAKEALTQAEIDDVVAAIDAALVATNIENLTVAEYNNLNTWKSAASAWKAGVDGAAVLSAKDPATLKDGVLTVPYGTNVTTKSDLNPYLKYNITAGEKKSSSFEDGVYTLVVSGLYNGADATYTVKVVEEDGPSSVASVDSRYALYYKLAGIDASVSGNAISFNIDYSDLAAFLEADYDTALNAITQSGTKKIYVGFNFKAPEGATGNVKVVMTTNGVKTMDTTDTFADGTFYLWMKATEENYVIVTENNNYELTLTWTVNGKAVEETYTIARTVEV